MNKWNKKIFLLLGITCIHPCSSMEEMPLTPIGKRSPLVIQGGDTKYGSTSSLNIPELGEGLDALSRSSTRDEAEERDLNIKYQTARMYILGQGLTRDVHKAVQILNECVEKKHGPSHFALGQIYHHGTEVIPQDLSRAYQLYTYGAALEEVNCMVELGVFHLEGKHTIHTPADSLRYFTQAKDLDHPKAMYYLGKMHMDGIGVLKNKKLAKRYIRQAAQLGYEPALEYLKSQCCGFGGTFK